MDVLGRADLPFPHSLPEFQRLFPDDAACAAYLEKARWGDGFACPHCGTAGEPFHFENLSFLKTYSAARADRRRTTWATVSIVGPDGKIATVASADMHKPNVGAVFFF